MSRGKGASMVRINRIRQEIIHSDQSHTILGMRLNPLLWPKLGYRRRLTWANTKTNKHWDHCITPSPRKGRKLIKRWREVQLQLIWPIFGEISITNSKKSSFLFWERMNNSAWLNNWNKWSRKVYKNYRPRAGISEKTSGTSFCWKIYNSSPTFSYCSANTISRPLSTRCNPNLPRNTETTGSLCLPTSPWISRMQISESSETSISRRWN